MYDLKVDDEVFDSLVVSYLKSQVAMVLQENEHMTHPEDKAYNTHLLPALLTVIKYFSIPNEYDRYIHQVFGSNDDDDKQLSFKFDEDDNRHPGFHYTAKGDDE
jgi:hypothetical protein